MNFRNYSGLLAACGGSPGFCVGAGGAAVGGKYRSKKEKSLWMMVGEPGEGKPRHSLSGTTGLSSDREWRGLPSPGSTTASSRLLHVFERYWPQAAPPAPTQNPWRTAVGSEESSRGET